MNTNTYLIFLILPIFFAEIRAPLPTGSPINELEKKCECLNTEGLQTDIDTILDFVNDVFRANGSQLSHISSTLGDVKEAVQDKTCHCSEGSVLLQLEERANELIDDALMLANESATCACTNSNTMINNTQTILRRLDALGSLTNKIKESIDANENETIEIKTQMEVIVKKSGSGNCDIESLKEDNRKINVTLEEIKRKICDMQEKGCVCEDQFKVIYDTLGDGIQSILDKLENISKTNYLHTEILLKYIENIEKKLDNVIEKNNTSTNNSCDCLTLTEYLKNLPERKMHEEKLVKPWEISEKCKEKLLCDYESCIKDAIHDLDDWFKPGTWSKMPESVKKVMITLYCKVGYKCLKSFKTVKVQLEAGNWKGAAAKLAKTRWATRYDPVSAKDLTKKLTEVN